jgi:hypothetical protein
MTKYGLILWIILYGPVVLAQKNIAIGTWRTHFSFRDAHSIAPTENGAFCAGNNSLFFFDLEDRSLNRIGKIDGLSDTRISTAARHESMNILLIAYINGNIDLVRDNQVTNINTIAETPTGTSKVVSHIIFFQNLAYLSTDFGVVVLDLEKEEVKEAYTNIGSSGERIKINFGAVYRDTLFLATAQGVMAGGLEAGNNLQDFENWKRFSTVEGLPNAEASTISSNLNQLIVSYDYDGIYQYQQGIWKKLNYQLNMPALHMTSFKSPITITTSEMLLSVDESFEIEELSNEIYPKPQSAALNQHGLWVADSINGLITSAIGPLASLFPSGPFSDSLFKVCYVGNTVIALPPGYDDLGKPLRTSLGFFSFQDGIWGNYNATGYSDTESFPLIKDLVDVTFNVDGNRFYFASFGEGIVEWVPGEEVNVFDETSPGSTLKNIFTGGRNVLVSSVLTDDRGQIWACNYGNTAPIHCFNPDDGIWKSFNADFQAGRFPLDLQQAGNGDFWLRLDPVKGGGIMVFNSESLTQKHLTNIQGQGGLPSMRVYDLEIDKNGQIWIGTDKGITHYPFPFDILENPVVNASPVLIGGRPLLKDEIVTAIAVDGGNRKWIGTENGVWLFSEQGDSLINHFNQENSPLPSNVILDITINGETGEVFLVTDAGMVSYRGTSSEGELKHQQVQIFPNPVTREYHGLVGISGLTENAIVKVTDIGGNLVKEFKAAGGTAVWDISDYQSRRVKSGVYLVFSSSADGNETFVGKIAVIN